MAGERIDNLSEARRLAREHRPHNEAVFTQDITAGPRPGHGVSGVGMDGIQADFSELRDAERELARLHDSLVDHLKDATRLAGPLPDGTSPVTGPMRKAFHHRADMEGGVQAALLDYIDELVNIRVAILDTLATYEGVDNEAANRLNRQVAYLDEVVES